MAGKKVASIFDKNSSDDERDEHRHGQAFFAGGSEHSGQQILGPERETNLIESLLRDARRHGELNPEPSANTLPVTFWRNGFTVGDDNVLRDYTSNREFLNSLRRGEVPPELASRVQSGMIDVKLDNKAFQDFEPSKQAGRPAFTGEGRRLGAPAPAVAREGEQQQSSSETTIDSAKPSLDAIRQARLAKFASKPKPAEQQQ